MEYFTFRVIHQAAAVLAIAGFFVRGLAALQGAPWVSVPRPGSLPC